MEKFIDQCKKLLGSGSRKTFASQQSKRKRLAIESLEDRQMLAVTPWGNFTDSPYSDMEAVNEVLWVTDAAEFSQALADAKISEGSDIIAFDVDADSDFVLSLSDILAVTSAKNNYNDVKIVALNRDAEKINVIFENAGANTAFNVTSSTVGFYGVTFKGFTNSAILGSKSSVLTVDNAVFENNSTIVRGGAIYINGAGSFLSVIDSTFENNVAAISGGAIYALRDVIVDISGSRFIDNKANGSSAYGGAIFASGINSLVLNDTHFTGNTSSSQGGAVTVLSSTELLVTDSSFSGNGSQSLAGALQVNKLTTLTITNTSFAGNTSTSSYAGALYLKDVMVGKVQNSIFNGNTSNTFGGAVFLTASDDVIFTTVQFNGNSTQGRGGAITLSGAEAMLIDCLFADNKASLNGGGIYVTSNSDLKMSTDKGIGIYNYSTIINNEAKDGAGIYVHSGNVELEDIDLISNKASSNGGGAYVNAKASMVLKDTYFLRNVAASDGGGVYLNGISDTNKAFLSVLNANTMVSFEANRAVSGAAISASYADIVFNARVYFHGNLPTVSGGASLDATHASLYHDEVDSSNLLGSTDFGDDYFFELMGRDGAYNIYALTDAVFNKAAKKW